MLKLVKSSSFYESDEPQVTLLSLGSDSNGLEKKAAHEDIQAFLTTLTPKPGYTYLHINAMTAGEYHGSNRNADYFPEENLKKYYKTFETTPAHVYRHHINKDPKKSFGKVIYAIYNERMHRVELICECPDELVSDINDRILMGDYPTTSMATRTPFDTCSICGNKADSRQKYCTHLSTQLNKLYPDGRKVFAINDGPLTFFDISIVLRPADVNSSVLQKVAGEESIGSAELAELEGLTEDGFNKKAELKKLSELVKEITDGCYVVGASKEPERLLGSAAPKDLPLVSIEYLYPFDLSEVFSTMAKMGISPSIEFLAELIARKHLGEGFEGIGAVVKDALTQVSPSTLMPIIDYKEPESANPNITTALSKYAAECSLLPDAIEKRAYFSTNVGYAGNGPRIEPTERELQNLQGMQNYSISPEVSTGKLILGLGAAALLAKFFITKQIEKQLRGACKPPQNNVKIVIVKNASDLMITSKLAKMAMVNSLPATNNMSNNSEHSGPSAQKVGTKIAMKFMVNPSSKVGGKLSNLLKIFSIGSKLTSDY